jgi:hypothetical protein
MSVDKITEQRSSILDSVARGGGLVVLALAILVVEGVLLAWLIRATDSTERIIAGCLMVVALLPVAWMAFTVEREKTGAKQPLARAVDNVGAEKVEIERPAPDQIGAPDGSYVIGKPPAGWTCEETSLEQIIQQSPMLRAVRPDDTSLMPKISSMLLFQDKHTFTITPIVGKTKVNGRRIPIFLPEELRRKLTITTMRRRQPPFYVERSLADSMLSPMVQLIASGIMTVRSITPGVLPKTNRETLFAELRQELTDLSLNGKEIPFLAVETNVVTVKGDVFHYTLTIVNLRTDPVRDPEADRAAADFKEILETFRPLIVSDPERMERDDIGKADLAFEEFVQKSGKDWFFSQLVLSVEFLKPLNLSLLGDLDQAVNLLKPFRTFAQNIHIDDKELSGFWSAMDEAEKGNPEKFRNEIQRLLADVEDFKKKQAEQFALGIAAVPQKTDSKDMPE